MTIHLILFFLCFAIIASQRFLLALSIFLFLLPSYLLRFTLFGLPTTILEGMFWILFVVWILRTPELNEKIKELFEKNKTIAISACIFIVASTVSVLFAIDIKPALGAWKAFYIEPALFAVIVVTTIRNKKELHTLLYGLVLSGFVTGLFAFFQHFTGWMVPWDFWQNENTFRVTGWYGFPNGVGFFLALTLPFAFYLSIQKSHWVLRSASGLAVILSILGIVFAKSTGSLVGIVGGLGVLALLNKKTRWLMIGAGVGGLITLMLLPAHNIVRKELLLQDRSGQIRVAMWKESASLLKERGVFGVGLVSYKKSIEKYHTTVNGEGIEIFHHPHNQFLSFWVELGLLGLLSFIWIVVWLYIIMIRQKPSQFSRTLLFTLTVLL